MTTAWSTYDTTSRFSTGARRLHYHESGDGPPLVLLHGSGPGVSGWSNFAGNLPAFSRSFRTFVVDMPGYGDSFIPDSLDQPYPALAAPAVLDLLNELDVPSAHVLGNSMGAGVAAQLALLAPDRVARLVLMGAGGIGTSLFSPVPSEGIRRLMEFNDNPDRQHLAAWLDTMVYDPSLITEQLIETRMQAALRPGAVEWSRRTYNALYRRPASNGPAPVPLWAQAARIAAPTLITWGRDDRVLPLDNAVLPTKLIPNAELHVFGRCGHWAMIERKADFERVVLEFLTRPADEDGQ